MSIVRRTWVVGASVVVLAGGFAAAASPHRPEDPAPARDARHSAASSRPAGETAVVAPVPEAQRPAPPPPRGARKAPPAIVTAVVSDAPTASAAPEPLPMTWDDLFPAQPVASGASAAGMPCFDQLQGVGGISPCPEVTTGALKR